MKEKHKKLDKLTTDLEKDRQTDRSTSSKFELMGLKKAKLAIKDKINLLRYNRESKSK
mgnify:FL=1